MRRCLSDILKNIRMAISNEYSNLHNLFYSYEASHFSGGWVSATLYQHCRDWFLSYPISIRSTFIDMDDFERKTGLDFYYATSTDDIDILVSFCEYSYNFTVYLRNFVKLEREGIKEDFANFYVKQVLSVVEKLGYVPNAKDGITDFVPKNPAAIAVAEIIDEDLAYDVIEYNHHSMRGDLLAKKTTLLRFANLLEPKRAELKTINEKLSVNIFFMFNNLDLRHNNSTSGDKNYQQYTEQMSKADLEAWYDELYQMCLLAFLEFDNIERVEKVDALKKNYKS